MNIFINAVLGIINNLISLLPTADTTTITNISTYWASFRTLITLVSWLLPLSEIFWMLYAVAVIQIAILTWRINCIAIAFLTVGYIRLT